MTRRRRTRTYLVLALIALVVALFAWRSIGDSSTRPRAELPSAVPARAAGDSLIVEPDDGIAPIIGLLASARRSIDMTMYELDDPSVESVLATAAQRGVAVRVLLDGRLERSHNAAAFDFLRSRGVDVRWGSSRYFVTHEKTFVVDDTTAVVMSLNLVSRYYATTRDVAVVDRDPRDVQAIESVFRADLRGAATGVPAADDLVWSPDQSGADFLALIDSARRSIAVESEELSDPPTVAALVAAARRGVAVRVVMTYRGEWASAFSRIVAAGGRVDVLHGETPLYIHAKILVVDAGTAQGRALIGSENISTASLYHDRELGIVLMAPTLVQRLSAIVSADGVAGTPWR